MAYEYEDVCEMKVSDLASNFRKDIKNSLEKPEGEKNALETMLNYLDIAEDKIDELDLSNIITYHDLDYIELMYLCEDILHEAIMLFGNVSERYKVIYDRLDQIIPTVCPRGGMFTAYKKGLVTIKSNEPDTEYIAGAIIELKIPADAKRSSGFGRKCRCDRAFVKSIRVVCNGNEVDSCESILYCDGGSPFIYKKGQFVKPDSFDENRFKECSHGIHFFMTKEEAENYWYC